MHMRNKSFGFVRHSIWQVRIALIAVTLHVIFLPKQAIITAAVLARINQGFSRGTTQCSVSFGSALSFRESYLTSLCMSHPSSKQTVLIHISVFFAIQSQTARKQQRETRAGGIRLREVIVPFDEVGQGNISVSM